MTAASPQAEDLITLSSGSSTYLMAPQHGFRLMRWQLKSQTATRDILYWPDDPEGRAFPSIRGGNPILFPFAGRSFDRGRENFWRSPDGTSLPMPRHGFARQGRFRLIRQEDRHLEGVLEPDAAAREAYPYDYTFSVAYHFEELAFTVDLTLHNSGEQALPWSAGHHFYFTLPWHAGAERGHYRLNMEARKCAYHGPDGKLVMQKDRETCHDLADADLIDRIHWELRHNRVTFGPKSGEEDIHLIIGEDAVPGKNTAVLTWTGSEDAPYYCVEPWMGPPNAAEHGKGLHWVQPGEKQTFRVTVSLY